MDDIRIRFKHSTLDPEKDVMFNGRRIRAKNATTCELKKGDDVIASGRSYCVPGDQFCKSTGRKNALKRAIADFSFNKDQRASLWNKYFDSLKVK